MFRAVKNTLSECIASSIRNVGGGVGRKLRYRFYRKRLGHCGKRVSIDINVVISSPKDIFIGDDVWVDNGAILMAGKASSDRKTDMRENKAYKYQRGQLHIGDQVHIGPQVILQAHGGIDIGNKLTIAGGSKIYTLSHHYRNTIDKADNKKYLFGSMVAADDQFLIEQPVVIGNGAAIGLNCILLPGATVPCFTWLGTGIILGKTLLEQGAVYQVEQTLIRKSLDSNNSNE